MHEVELKKMMWEWAKTTGLADQRRLMDKAASDEFVSLVVEALGMKFGADGALDAHPLHIEAADHAIHRDRVLREVMALYESGYDGPFMGEPVKPLFKAIIAMTGRDDAPRRQAPDDWEPPGRLKRTPRPADQAATGKKRRGRR